MKHDSFFYNHAVFRKAELAAYLGQEEYSTPVANFLYYYTKKGKIIRLGRSIFAVVSPTKSKINPYLLAGKITRDAVVADHSALCYWTGNRTIPSCFYYMAKSPWKWFIRQNTAYCGITTPRGIQQAKQEKLGICEETIEGTTFRITGPERTLVDVLNSPKRCGGWKTAWQALESLPNIKLDLVLEYLKSLNNATATAKVGYYLDEHRDQFQLTDGQINELIALRPKQPCYVDRSKRHNGVFIKRWNLIIEGESHHQFQ
jgi:predicted transcriptional regulator of viral defense system